MNYELTKGEIDRKLEINHPTDEQLIAINNFRAIGTPAYTSEEIISVPILASNNLLHQNFAVWDVRSLETMTALFPGKDLMQDHAWYNTNSCKGFIYDAELWGRESIPEMDLAESPDPDLDRSIVNRDGGYHQVVLYSAIEAQNAIANDIRFRRKSDVSVGGIRIGTEICPLCNIPFDDKNCPHYPPLPELINWWYTEEQLAKLAPYWIRTGWTDSVELSFVVEGNCQQAKIFSYK